MISYQNQEHKNQNKLYHALDSFKESNEGENKMKTLKESALEFEPKQTLNIADLEKVSIDIELKDGEGKDANGELFKYKYFEQDEKQYRVAGSVIGQIKAILLKMPDLKNITVTKSGTGMSTRYVVMPYQEQEKTEDVKA